MMITLHTDKKYTVILSAYHPDNEPHVNMLFTERMKDRLLHEYHVNPIRAVGVYQGGSEQAFVIHTNSSHVVGDIKRLGLECYNQECVLVSNNRTHDIQLHNSDATTTHIGHTFRCYTGVPKGCKNYTVLRGCDYWVVN
jgi:hypothetical protein